MEKGAQSSLGRDREERRVRKSQLFLGLQRFPKLHLCNRNFPKKQGDVKHLHSAQVALISALNEICNHAVEIVTLDAIIIKLMTSKPMKHRIFAH